MSTENAEQFDVVVVGGGPSGSTAAAVTALHGRRVLVLESERFPRYQIGESLLPSTLHGVCRLTGATEAIEKAGFTRKRGGTFKWGSNPEPWTFTFSVSPRMAAPTGYSYHVERMEFDKILLDNARRVGAEVREQCPATRVEEEDGRVTGVWYRDAEGTERLVRARYVLDASGHKSRIYRSIGGERKYSDFFRNLALFGYFKNAKRQSEPNAGNILCVAFDSGWFWFIPLTETMTSVGAVVNRDLAGEIAGEPEKMLHKLIAECPLISEYLSGADRITEGEYGQIRVRKDYSYQNTRFWRPGFALIGDAACFVDPVFSSGVHLATHGALLAGRSVNSIMEGTLDEETAFAEFEARYRHEYRVFYEYLMSFYAMNSDAQSYFWRAKEITNSGNSELEAFVELVGGVSSGDFDLSDGGGQAMAKRVSAESSGLATAVSKVAGTDGENVIPLLGAPVVREAMQESEKVLARAQFGARFDAELPFQPGGLISSADGLAWVPSAK
ncbi:MAG TPA: tryptophan 7-halogenase [Trebonia sp.]|jgi:halogenation protein CepH|nr:tryptophan 7-halogenase [Trebonia sp.]